MQNAQQLVAATIEQHSLVRLVLCAPRQRVGGDAAAARKVVVKPLLLRGNRIYQFEYHAGNRVTHRNLEADAARDTISTLLEEQFDQGLLQTAEADFHLSIDAKRRATIRKAPPSRTIGSLAHDRAKQRIIPADTPCDFLARLGVMSESGRVIAARYDKFKQVNRFLEMVRDVADHLNGMGTVRVVDVGCGKSYLTFALYHYLKSVLQRDVQIVGLDRRADIVAYCSAIARDLKYEGLRFQVADVGDIRMVAPFDAVDMLVSLHACDTATDDALARAVEWGAKVILSAPCCQHELFKKIRNDALEPMLKHGVVRERLAALVTDALRASLLENAGYKVQILEFIETEHTPKNLLIRAVKGANPEPVAALRQEYETLRDFWHVQPYMEQRLKEGD